MGTYGFVWTSAVQIWPLPNLIDHLAGAGEPERPLLPERHEQLWHEPQQMAACMRGVPADMEVPPYQYKAILIWRFDMEVIWRWS